MVKLYAEFFIKKGVKAFSYNMLRMFHMLKVVQKRVQLAKRILQNVENSWLFSINFDAPSIYTIYDTIMHFHQMIERFESLLSIKKYLNGIFKYVVYAFYDMLCLSYCVSCKYHRMVDFRFEYAYIHSFGMTLRVRFRKDYYSCYTGISRKCIHMIYTIRFLVKDWLDEISTYKHGQNILELLSKLRKYSKIRSDKKFSSFVNFDEW